MIYLTSIVVYVKIDYKNRTFCCQYMSKTMINEHLVIISRTERNRNDQNGTAE